MSALSSSSFLYYGVENYIAICRIFQHYPCRCNGGAVSADIASANCVGYVTSTVPKDGSKTFALTLTACDNPSAPVRVDDLLTSSEFFGGSYGVADEIWRWDTKVNKWAKYFYEKTGRGDSVSYSWKKWNYTENKAETLTDDDAVSPGETFIFTRNGDATITLTLAGQVKEFSATPSYSIPKDGSVYMAYPWPIEIKLSNLQSLVATETYSAFFGGSYGVADELWCWDTSVNKWAKYFYEKTGRGDSVSYAWKKWNYAENKAEALTDADKLAPGEGFIFTRNGDATLTFTWNALETSAE